MVHRTLRPRFGLNPMRKREEFHQPQGQVGPKPQVGPPEPNFGPNLNNPKNGQEPQVGLWKPPEATISGPERLSLNSGEDLSFTNVPSTKGSRHDAYMV
ncbi:hypothetical protein O181_014397 [Austropuccinia psidii MF-1]|uniref:Uncharacterized protein n=1 Tax=Austropuccinia psidii MF-1 TaxID=1389203 RepID=A0A9Q3C043_9BASI|nr:hypothetical protein [Austropuccinia psidii MF-1]